MSRRILVVAAHADDEILGCGGVMSKFSKLGDEIYTMILGEGKTSRDGYGVSEIDILNEEIRKANAVVGVKEVFTADFPDNAFDSVALLKLVKKVDEIKNKVKPEIIFTHHIGDINIDHQITHKAVLTATRPMLNECVKEVYSYEVPSSTEWNSYSRETVFVPNVFFDITDEIDAKVAAMAEYKSELREYPHPRSLRHIKELANVNGTKVGLKYSENFALVRSLR